MLAKFCVMTRLKEHENSNLTSKMRVYDGEKLKGHRSQGQDAAGIQGRRRRRRRHDGHLHPLRLQDAVGDVQLRRDQEIAADPVHLMYVLEQSLKREQFPTRPRRNISNSSRRSWRRAMPSSSARKSRRPISNPMANTARTCSTATSPMPTPGSKTRTSRTPTPASCSTAARSTTSCPRSRSRPASPTRRTSATKS
jgi:hypothetical protein